jgi:hypothetical protein
VSRRGTIGLLWLAASCAGQTRPPATPSVDPRASEAEISELVERALQADSRGETADSLYAPHAVVIADGRARRGSPRFAGVEPGGQVAVANSQLEIRGTAAWGDVEYRWQSNSENLAREGRASFVVTPAQGRAGWWIVQVHSSTAR